MIAKFNPTGTHLHKGFLKVRIDLYPEPTDKTYAIHHIYYQDETSRKFKRGYKGAVDEWGSPIDQADYNVWWDSLPKVWKINPCLCHFVTIDPDTPLDELIQMFDGDTITQLDDALSKSDIAEVRQIMRTKLGSGKELPEPLDSVNIINMVNERFLEEGLASPVSP